MIKDENQKRLCDLMNRINDYFIKTTADLKTKSQLTPEEYKKLIVSFSAIEITIGDTIRLVHIDDREDVEKQLNKEFEEFQKNRLDNPFK